MASYGHSNFKPTVVFGSALGTQECNLNQFALHASKIGDPKIFQSISIQQANTFWASNSIFGVFEFVSLLVSCNVSDLGQLYQELGPTGSMSRSQRRLESVSKRTRRRRLQSGNTLINKGTVECAKLRSITGIVRSLIPWLTQSRLLFHSILSWRFIHQQIKRNHVSQKKNAKQRLRMGRKWPRVFFGASGLAILFSYEHLKCIRKGMGRLLHQSMHPGWYPGCNSKFGSKQCQEPWKEFLTACIGMTIRLQDLIPEFQ